MTDLAASWWLLTICKRDRKLHSCDSVSQKWRVSETDGRQIKERQKRLSEESGRQDLPERASILPVRDCASVLASDTNYTPWFGVIYDVPNLPHGFHPTEIWLLAFNRSPSYRLVLEDKGWRFAYGQRGHIPANVGRTGSSFIMIEQNPFNSFWTEITKL